MKIKHLFDEIDLVARITQHIRTQRTGTPPEFARKMGMSERQLHRYLEDMKDYEVKIGYCKRRHTYYYEEDKFLMFKACMMDKGEERKITGGENIFHFYENNFQTDRIWQSGSASL